MCLVARRRAAGFTHPTISVVKADTVFETAVAPRYLQTQNRPRLVIYEEDEILELEDSVCIVNWWLVSQHNQVVSRRLVN